MNLLLTLAQAATPAASSATTAGSSAATGAPAPPWLNMLSQFGPIVLIVVFFMLFMGGSKKKQERERKTLLDNLKKGDTVRLIGGEYGTVAEVRGTKVLVKVDENSNTKILYAREAIQAVEKDEAGK